MKILIGIIVALIGVSLHLYIDNGFKRDTISTLENNMQDLQKRYEVQTKQKEALHKELQLNNATIEKLTKERDNAISKINSSNIGTDLSNISF
jgi:peptidoglycan hydrolase CwlO-like protein